MWVSIPDRGNSMCKDLAESMASCSVHLEQRCPVELSGIMEVFCICADTVATGHL